MYEIDVSIGRDKVHKNYICFIPLFCVGSFFCLDLKITISIFIVGTPPPVSKAGGGGGVEPPIKF